MADGGDAVSRLDALEMRIAHQDAVIEDLNGVITAQWARIEALTRQLAAQEDRLREAEQRDGAGLPQPRPPHY